MVGLVHGSWGLAEIPKGRNWGRLYRGDFRGHTGGGVHAYCRLIPSAAAEDQVRALTGNRSSECSLHPRAVCILFRLGSGCSGWVGTSWKGGFSPSGLQGSGLGGSRLALCPRIPGMLWASLPGPPPTPSPWRCARCSQAGHHCCLGASEDGPGPGGRPSLPCPLRSSSSAGRAERLEPSLRKPGRAAPPRRMVKL